MPREAGRLFGECGSGRLALPKHLLARRFKLAAENLGGAFNLLDAILEPNAQVQIDCAVQFEEHTAAHPQCARG